MKQTSWPEPQMINQKNYYTYATILIPARTIFNVQLSCVRANITAVIIRSAMTKPLYSDSRMKSIEIK